MPEKKAQIILEVAQVIGNRLEMSELLGSLNEALTPIIHFERDRDHYTQRRL